MSHGYEIRIEVQVRRTRPAKGTPQREDEIATARPRQGRRERIWAIFRR